MSIEKTHEFSSKHAVIIGSSIVGLITAKMLAQHFTKVTLLDRDEIPTDVSLRKRVPQGAHVHVLLDAGKHSIEEFYPGLFEEMIQAGASVADTGNEVAWFHHGVWKKRYVSGLKGILCTRPFLEHHIRCRTQAVHNINFLMGTSVEELIATPDKKSIIGVKYHDKKSSTYSELRADLVVDASGRGSQAPAWLSVLGYQIPEEEHIGIDLSYTSCVFKKPDTFNADWKIIIHYPRTPHDWKCGVISCVENNHLMVSLSGYFKDSAPLDDEGFIEFAHALPRPEIYNYLKKTDRVSDIRIHKIPSSRWRHYEKLRSFPENLVLIGDSVCAFNPIFGQGMTVAAKSASLLNKMLLAGELNGISDRYRKALPAIIKVPWFITSVLDMKYSQTKGKRPLGYWFLSWYVGKLLELTSISSTIYHQFSKLIHLKKGLWVILSPRVSVKVLTYGIKSIFIPLEKRANTKEIPYDVSDCK